MKAGWRWGLVLSLSWAVFACDDGDDGSGGALDLGGRVDGAQPGLDLGDGRPTPEAGTPEAGAPEAGPPEAGPPEAGAPEAGAPDAGPDEGAGGCEALEDCGPDEACGPDGRCVPRCTPGACEDGHCNPAWWCEAGPCEGDADCAPGSTCGEGGQCFADCQDAQPEICNGRDDDCDGQIDNGLGIGEACTVGTGACERVGARACDPAGEVVCQGEAGQPTSEICNAIDDDCDGVIDNGLGVGEPCEVGLGECARAGVTACGEGENITCDAQPGPGGSEACNGLDDDCDGAADEDFRLGDPCQAGEGVCATGGIWVCDAGGGALCDAEVPAGAPEVCDGVDNDCDGQTDEGLAQGPCETEQPGLCRAGTRRCVAGAEACAPDVPAAAETCDGQDEDCDGQTDEGLGTVACGVGVCQRDLPACVDGQAPACDPLVGQQAQELCNGLDDDCDGQTDEGVAGEGEPCGVGVGACQRAGTRQCVDGAWACDAQPGEPALETCNGVDDDCDGLVDDGAVAEGAGCPVGVGACERVGAPVCEDGQVRCVGEPGPPADEVCNAADDDCDGLVDEGFGEVCGQGECQRVLAACDGGEPAVCDPLAGATPEVCDGLDNDCDGQIDEAAAGVGDGCDVGGGCAVPGVQACADGRLVCQLDPQAAPAERCNGLDDDCDGVTDEAPEDEGGACSAGLGACEQPGQLRCMLGQLACDAVAGLPAAEACNGEDDDCNGAVDDGLGTVPCGQGVCARDLPACTEGEPTACNPLDGAAPEVCDGLDNDCDGVTDEDADGGNCAVGQGACVAQGVDRCVGGQLVCDAERLNGSPEACNGVDDDCDGQTDEGLGLGEACSAGVGACAAQGQQVCDAQGGVACDALPGQPGDEVCNGLDDDCDGLLDEDTAGQNCDTGTPGVCGPGLTTCEGGVPGCAAQAQAGDEVCNGLDDDCDGQVDDGLGTVPCGEGACARELPACVDGAPPVCNPDAQAQPETCNLADDDCDGQVDEGLGGEACQAGLGVCAADGVMRCVAGAMACDAAVAEPGVELCNGLDDDCDGLVDDEPQDVGPCAAGVGACRDEAVSACVDGEVVCPARAGQPDAEVCDGADNDCDGALDEGFGSTVCGLGACRHAVPNCDGDGEPPVCDPMEGAQPEICDGLDNDCDGVVDNDAPGGGDNCVVGQGACRIVAVTRCVNGAIACPASPLAPSPETCNQVDDDCDGQVDEDAAGTGVDCTWGMGICQRAGQMACVDGFLGCNVQPGQPEVEVCNGLDDDCDGFVDDDLGTTACGVGQCRREVPACTDGQATACEPFPARDEICDGLDNDCDGQVDEDTGTLDCGFGVCARQLPRCVDGRLNTCDPLVGAGEEVCDGLDNDCDGVVDDGIAPQACSDGLGVCQRFDFEICEGGQWVCGARAGQPDPAGEACNNLDDDCDGRTDEQVPGTGDACARGVGGCERQGVVSCLDGFIRCSAVAGDHQQEVCNDVDDDCDGVTDEVGPDCNANGIGDTCDLAQGIRDCNANGIPDVCDLNERRSPDCNDNGIPDECNGDGDDCVPDLDPPTVETWAQGAVINRGMTIQLIVEAEDDGRGVDEIGLFVDGEAVALDANGHVFHEFTRPGFIDVVGWATDRAGNRAEHAIQVRVLEPTDGQNPVINIHSPNNGQQVFADVVFNISVQDQSLTDWWLTWGPNGNPAAEEIARGTDPVDQQDVATIPVNGLQAGWYQFQLTATDVNGRGARITGSFQVPDCAPVAEICDGVDNDCDGVADDGVAGKGAPCTVGAGACEREGVGVCGQAGDVVCSVAPGLPQVELCDGVDNDCDGAVDERWPLGQVCHLGVGGCRQPGTVVCTGDTTAAICNAQASEPQAEACNGVDDDCDGATDEGIRGCGVDTPPEIQVLAPLGDVPERGDVLIDLDVTDDFGLAAVSMTVNGVDTPLDANHDATLVNALPRVYRLVIQATDDEGQTTELEHVFRVLDPLDQFNPQASIDSPRPDALVQLVSPVRGVAFDATLVQWTLSIGPPGEAADQVLATGTTSVDGELAELDPALFEPGVYQLTLEVEDVNYRRTSTVQRFRIDACGDNVEVCDGRDNDCDRLADEGLANCPGDEQPPTVQIGVPVALANLGEPLEVSVFAQDDIWVDRVELVVNGVAQPWANNTSGDIVPQQAGVLTLVARAFDSAGNVGEASVAVRILDPDDVDAPEIEITQPAADAAIDGPVVVQGRIQDPNLWAWSVHDGTAADPTATLLAEGTDPMDGVLVEFDPSAKPDGAYQLFVQAEDVNGRRRTLSWPYRLRPCEPAPELCDGVDNDCDASVDEDYAELGQPCEIGVGECVQQGQLACRADNAGVACAAVPIPPQPERCDALDHDCDGLATNGFAVGQACRVGTGACERLGRTVCNGAGDDVQCDAVAGQPAAEVCDQVDNDCDGDTDEGFPQIECGVGACFHVVGACEGAAACDPFRGARAETCNQIDDDCDGQVDEEPADAGAACHVGLGVCARNGVEVCEAGQVVCSAVEGAAGPEVCDQLDNDCDGQTDEEFVCPDESDPVVQVAVSPIPVDIGQAVTITVIAQDDRGEPDVQVTVNGAPLALDNTGRATYVPQDFGAFTVRVVVTDDAGNQTIKEVTGAARDPNDRTYPTAEITGPEEDSEHGTAVAITGTAADDTLVEWVLAYASKSDPNQWVEFARGDQPVVDGELGTLDPTLMVNGMYTVRLQVRDASGLRTSDFRALRVYGDAKVGLFTITYTDATISVAGMPLTVERTYDSRVKTKEDFGVGWTLDIRQGRLEHNKPIDEGWEFQPGGFFGLDRCAGANSTEIKLTEFHLSENRSYTFRPELVSLGSGGHGICWATLQFHFVKSKGGGRATLQPVGPNRLLFLNDGSGHIYEDFGEDYRLDQVLLTVEDGREFAFDRGRDGIFILRDQHGNQTEIRNDGVHNSSGKGIEFEKDAQGRITALVLPGGARVTYTYDANGDLTAVTDEAGDTTRFAYNRSHGLTEITDPTGNTPVRNEYDESGRLVAVVYPDGTRTAMDHDLDGRTEVVRDRLGHVEILTYDEQGKVVRKVDKLGQVWLYAFDANGRPLSETAPDGVVTRREYDAAGHVVAEFDGLGRAKRRTYTAEGWLATETDRSGGVTRYAYDAAGNLVSMIDPLGEETRYTYDAAGNTATMTDPEGGVTRYTYDEYGQMLSEESAEGVLTRYTYNERGGKTSETLEWHVDGELIEITTQYEYDEKNRLVAQIDALGGRKTVEYDPRGNKVAETDASGARYTWSYDDRNNLIRRGFPDATFEIYRYDAEDRRVATVDRGGRETRVAYDALGRVIRSDRPDGTHTEREYDVRSKVTREVKPNGGEVLYRYDNAGQLIETTNAVGDVTTYEYDQGGRRTAVTNGNGNTTRYEYDGKGQRTAVVFPDDTRREKRYDGRGLVVAEVDQAGRTTTFEHDGDGRLVRILDPIGGETQYAWDEMKHRTQVTDALGRVNSYEYDRLGRLAVHTLPSGRQEFMTHDLMGNVVQKVDFAGQEFRFEYDEVNQLVRRELPDGTVEHGAHTPTERRSQLEDARGVTRWTYDGLDRETERVEPDGTFVRHAYDGLGNPTQVRTAQGVTQYTYDPEGRLETVTDRFDRTTRYTYDGAGNRASLTLPNGVRTTYEYDALERLVGLQTVDAEGRLVARYDYTLGPVGERLVVAEGHTGRTLRYTYDDLTRLIREQVEIDGQIERDVQYTYDLVGNRLTRTVDGVQQVYEYDVDDRLIRQDGVDLAYDDNGRLIAVGDHLTQTWDPLGRLVEVQTNGATVDYEYDVDGQRVGRTLTVGEDVQSTHYVIDKSGEWAQVLEERADDGTLLAEYTYGMELLGLRQPNVERYYVIDGSQSVRALTDPDGAITDLYAYDAFGGLLDEVGDTDNPHLFGGQYLDPNTGYYYMRARWYDPEAGRFTSRDPVEGLERDPQTLHRYVYVRNEPLTNYDPNGEFMVSVMAGVGIQGTLRHSYTTFLIRFLLSTLKIAFCQLQPAYADRDQAIMKMLDGMPGAMLEVRTAQKAIASAYRMILVEGAKIAFEMAKEYKMTKKEVDVHYGHFIAAAQCHKSNPHCRPSPALAKAKWLRTETKKKFDWQGAAWDAAKLAIKAMKGFKNSCEKAKFAAEVTEKLWSYMPKF